MSQGKVLQTVVQIAGSLDPSLKKAMANASKFLDDMSQDALDAMNASEKLSSEIGAQKSVLSALEKAYASYVIEENASSDEAQRLAGLISDLSGDLSENKKTLDAAEKAAKKYASQMDESQSSSDKLRAKISSQESALSELKEKYVSVTLEQGQNSDEAKALGKQINSLSGELKENKSKLNDAETAADQFGKAAEDAGEKAEESAGGYTILKGAIANLASDAISAAIEAFKELATEGDNALAMLQSKTGASSEQLAKYKDVMYEVYNSGYGDSLDTVEDALSTVITLTDNLNNAELQKVTSSALTLSDVYGFDVTESVRAANSLMDQFEVSSDEAFNLIVQGAQNGLNQNGDLLDVINEYAVQFKSAGYSANDMFNMLANGTEAGTWSVDKLGDAVKEFNIRLSDGTANDYLTQLGMDAESTIDAFNRGGADAQDAISGIMQSLMSCDDATMQYSIGVGLFGTMWEDLGGDAVAALLDTQGEIDATATAMDAVNDAASGTLENTMATLGRTLKSEVLQPVVDQIVPALKELVSDNMPQLQEAGASLGSLFSSTASSLLPMLITIVNELLPVIVDLLNLILPVASEIITAILPIVAKLLSEYLPLLEPILDIVIQLLDALMPLIELLAEAISWALSKLIPILTFIYQIVGFILVQAITALITAINWIVQAVKDVIAWFEEFGANASRIFTEAWEGIKEIWNAVATWFSENITGPISGFFSDTWSAIKTGASTAWDNVKGAWNSVSTWFTENISGPVGSTFSGLWSDVETSASSAWDGIKSTASTVFGNIYDTIKTKMDDAKQKVSDIIDAIKEFFNFQFTWPEIPLPHFSITPIGWKVGDLLKGKLPTLSVSWYAQGGILDGAQIFGAAGGSLLGGGEAGPEAVLPLSTLWDKMANLMRSILDERSGQSYTAQAGRLMEMDDFSLSELSESNNFMIYYDFSNFTWSPTVESSGGEDESFMARMKAHEAEFFDWLEDFIAAREAGSFVTG